MTKGYEKWDRYVPGKITWINANAKHPHRAIYVDYVLKNCKSAIEVGAGEMLEYAAISSQEKVDYSIVDVSDSFLRHCKENFPEVKTYCCPMEEFSLEKADGYQRDVVYAASVIEHTKNVESAIRNMTSLAKNFHFVMFKWSYKGRRLVPFYHPKKKYWTTVFNINLVLDVIRKYGIIEYADLITKSGLRIPFAEYRPKKGRHRTGSYLMIHGQSLA